MLDFILSKFNMLILVTAMFAIGSYFAFYLAQSLEKQQAQTVITQITEDSFGLLNSPTLCHQTTLTLPQYINTLGRTDTGNKLYYIFRVTRQENINNAALASERLNAVIFSIRNKKTGEILAAERIITPGNVQLFKWDSTTGGVSMATDHVDLNPNSAVIREDALKVIKEVHNNLTTLFVIPCSSDPRTHQCEANYGNAVNLITATRTGGRWNC